MNSRNNGIAVSVLLVLCFLVVCNSTPSEGEQAFISEGYSNKIVDGYWLYLPRNFASGKKWPVIMFLQGSDGASPDPRTSKEDGPAKYALNNIKKGGRHQLVSDTFIIVNPHMRTGPIEKRQWYQYPNILKGILDEVILKYSGDSSRIYLTGLSAGGHGSWGLAKKYPEKFAAIVPIAGRVNCKSGCEKLTNIPIWIIHNTGDPTVDFQYSLKTIDYFEKKLNRNFIKIVDTEVTQDQMNAALIFSALDYEGHDAWSHAYKSNSLYQWLLTKKIK